MLGLGVLVFNKFDIFQCLYFTITFPCLGVGFLGPAVFYKSSSRVDCYFTTLRCVVRTEITGNLECCQIFVKIYELKIVVGSNAGRELSSSI